MHRCTLTLLCLLASTSLLVSIEAADIDYHLERDPVVVQIVGKNCGPSLFTDNARDYNQEYRRGIFSFLQQSPVGLGADIAPQNLPRALFSRVTNSVTSTTTWQFTLAWNETAPNFQPYDAFTKMSTLCVKAQEDVSGTCVYEAESGGAWFYYVNMNGGVFATDRQWLKYVDSVRLQCCDGSFAISRQLCPDCLAKNYLPIILGTTLSVGGLILVSLAVWIGCRVQKRRKQRVIDAGHKAPPKNIGPAFQPHSPNHVVVHTDAFMMKPNQMAHHVEPAAPPVVVKVETPPENGKKHHRKDEPDEISAPEGETDKGHSKHDKSKDDKRKDDKHKDDKHKDDKHKDDKHKEDKKHGKH